MKGNVSSTWKFCVQWPFWKIMWPEIIKGEDLRDLQPGDPSFGHGLNPLSILVSYFNSGPKSSIIHHSNLAKKGMLLPKLHVKCAHGFVSLLSNQTNPTTEIKMIKIFRRKPKKNNFSKSFTNKTSVGPLNKIHKKKPNHSQEMRFESTRFLPVGFCLTIGPTPDSSNKLCTSVFEKNKSTEKTKQK